jgi:GNAT superfamily N-acetyltransferase
MYQQLESIELKTGEIVEAGIVIGPDPEWADPLIELLQHKGEPWIWQISELFHSGQGIDAYAYILHRGGTPFANIMTFELSGVGFLSHVFTEPDDRNKGASSRLMQLQSEHFASRQGKALFLDTDVGSVAYRIYEKFGFRSIEKGFDSMAYHAISRETSEATYFARAETAIQPLDWTHWPASVALFTGDFPGIVRCAPLKLIGRQATEAPFLPLLREEKSRHESGASPRALALQNTLTTAVVGIAAWDWHPIWPDTCLLDIFCHPDFWDKAEDLLAALALPDADTYLAYGDDGCKQKIDVLLAAGFNQVVTLEKRIPSYLSKAGRIDVALFERE